MFRIEEIKNLKVSPYFISCFFFFLLFSHILFFLRYNLLIAFKIYSFVKCFYLFVQFMAFNRLSHYFIYYFRLIRMENFQ